MSLEGVLVAEDRKEAQNFSTYTETLAQELQLLL